MRLLTYNNYPSYYTTPLLEDLFTNSENIYQSIFPELKHQTNTLPSNVTEEENSYTISSQLVAYRKEDIELQVNHRELTISAQKKDEHTEQESSVKRSFRLPDNADLENISAVFQNGILEINIAKSNPITSRTINIEA